MHPIQNIIGTYRCEIPRFFPPMGPSTLPSSPTRSRSEGRKVNFFPMLNAATLLIGFDIYTFGFFAIGGQKSEIEQGYFAGKVVNFFNHEKSPTMACLTLPFPVLEGMSGCPILTYHNGPKLVGIGIGNRQSRILASEVIEVEDGSTRFRESINRIVEYGVAHHAVVIQHFLAEASIPCAVSDDRIPIPNLE